MGVTTTSEPLDDVVARLSELGATIAQRKRREEERPEISVEIVMLTVVPPALFEDAAVLFFRNHVDATSSSSEEEDEQLEMVSYEGAAGVMRCVICMDDVEVGSQVANLPWRLSSPLERQLSSLPPSVD